MITLFNEKLNLLLHGMTANLSRYGALVRIQPPVPFGPGTPVTVTVFLPPRFTGQEQTIRLQGEAVTAKVDEANKGIALEFRQALRQFERIDKLGLH